MNILEVFFVASWVMIIVALFVLGALGSFSIWDDLEPMNLLKGILLFLFMIWIALIIFFGGVSYVLEVLTI